MSEDVLGMSGTERERAHVVRSVVEKKRRQREAVEKLDVTVRQVRRWVRLWKKDGDVGLISKQRGRIVQQIRLIPTAK